MRNTLLGWFHCSTGLDDVTAGNDVISRLDASCRWRCPAAADKIKKNAIQDSSETRGNRTIAIWKGKQCGFWIALNDLLSFSVFCHVGVKAAEKRQRGSGPRTGHCQAVMLQIYLYKNQWVAKLKRGCRGEETIWKMNCPFNAQWRILSTSQRNDAFNHSLEFFLLLFVVPSGLQPGRNFIRDCVMFIWSTPLNLSNNCFTCWTCWR